MQSSPLEQLSRESCLLDADCHSEVASCLAVSGSLMDLLHTPCCGNCTLCQSRPGSCCFTVQLIHSCIVLSAYVSSLSCSLLHAGWLKHVEVLFFCLQDWLFLAYLRVRGVEYGLLVATFVAIMVLGLELGIATGIVAASLLFAYNYSKVGRPWSPCAVRV